MLQQSTGQGKVKNSSTSGVPLCALSCRPAARPPVSRYLFGKPSSVQVYACPVCMVSVLTAVAFRVNWRKSRLEYVSLKILLTCFRPAVLLGSHVYYPLN